MIAGPQRTLRGVAVGQQGGFSGQIPGTTSDPTQVGLQFSTIHQYPANSSGPTTSPDGDQVAGVGHAVLNNAGNPVVAMGNLNAPASSNHGAFQDGAFVFFDADGNHVAGYSQPTGLWGFGGLRLASFSDEVRGSSVTCTPGTHTVADCTGATSTSWFDGTTGKITAPGIYIAMPAISSPLIGSATGQYVWWSSDFDFTAYVPLDPFAVAFPTGSGTSSGQPVVATNVQSLGAGDVPFHVSTGVGMPSSATGWTLSLNLVIGRLAY